MSKIPQADLSQLKNGNSDLLKRLGNFLPQMAAANEELDKELKSAKNGSNPVQIDSILQKDDGEQSDDASACNSNEVDENTGGGQTIQMTVALGDLESNPIMSMLTYDEKSLQDDDNEQHKPEDSIEVTPSDRNKSVLALLGKGGDKDEDNANSVNDVPLFTVRSTRRK